MGRVNAAGHVASDEGAGSSRLVGRSVCLGAAGCDLSGMAVKIATMVGHGLLNGVCGPEEVGFR